MRLSPVLLAAFTVSATLGFSSRAKGETIPGPVGIKSSSSEFVPPEPPKKSSLELVTAQAVDALPTAQSLEDISRQPQGNAFAIAEFSQPTRLTQAQTEAVTNTESEGAPPPAEIAAATPAIAPQTNSHTVQLSTPLYPPTPQADRADNGKTKLPSISPPFEDAAVEFNNWKYRQFWEPIEPPQPPTLGEHESKSPRIGGFRGPSAVLTMLRNNSPAASFEGGVGGSPTTIGPDPKNTETTPISRQDEEPSLLAQTVDGGTTDPGSDAGSDTGSEGESPAAESEPTTSEEVLGSEAEAEQLPQDTRVLVAEVKVQAVSGELAPELESEVFGAIATRPGSTTTRSQLQEDINNVFATGFFANVQAIPEDTSLGVRITFRVQPNPVLTSVRVSGNEVLPQTIVDEIFQEQYGDIINLVRFQADILELNQWYQDNGYVLAQVIAAPQISPDGVATLVVAEGVIEDIDVRFITQDGLTEDEAGNPIQGRTRDFIITREFASKPGDVFNQPKIEQDLQQVFGLGIFEDVRLSLSQGEEDPLKVKVVVNVTERSTGSVTAGAGFNFRGDIFGTATYRQDNLGGNNQKLSTEVQLSTSDLLFDLSFTDPWIAGDPHRTAYTVNAFGRQSTSLVFDNGPTEVLLENGDDVRLRRFGGGLSFTRPLSNGWTGSLGTQYQRVVTTDESGDRVTEDELGNPLSFSGSGRDDLWTFQLGVVQDRRNNPANPTSGSLLRLGTEQSVPVGSGSILMNRLRGSYSYYIPVELTGFGDGPEAFAFNVQAGTVLGDLPPYEAFALGGGNSVRGFEEGGLAAGRSFVQATAEYRFPLFASFLGGVLFVDFGSALGSQGDVLGDPGLVRDKPGSGFGFGPGLRVRTPLGPLRIDFGFSDDGDSRIHFGLGERF